MPVQTQPKSFGDLWGGLVDLLYPPSCAYCQTPLPALTRQRFCPACTGQLQSLRSEQCFCCSAPTGLRAATYEGCPHCRKESFAFTQALSWGGYQGILRQIILRLKQSTGETLAHQMSREWAEQCHDPLAELKIDTVVPVPLHWSRRLWRGYNQAAALANGIARNLGKPCRSGWLWRHQQTPRQVTLTSQERRRHLRQAFRARLPAGLQGKTLLLVDDVMTTGSTADACARTLLGAGAGRVHVAVLARALGETATFDKS